VEARDCGLIWVTFGICLEEQKNRGKKMFAPRISITKHYYPLDRDVRSITLRNSRILNSKWTKVHWPL
jgi:hypothetical protein